jgi:hypothetical protein
MPAYMKVSSWLLTTCAVFCCAAGAHASTFTIPTDDDLIIGARAIVRGKVLSVTCQLDDRTGRVFTYVRLSVREVLKGQVSDREIVLKEEGGQTANRGSIIFGTPGFEKGEKVLLYLDTWRDGSLRVYQMFLGKFSIVADPATGEQIVIRAAPDKNTSVIQNEPHRVGRLATSRMELSAYREMVSKRIKANREQSQDFHQAYYSTIPMLAEPAEYQRGSGDELEPQYTFLTLPPPRWFEPDVGQPVVFMVNPEGAPNPQIMDDISAAMNTWSTVPGCSLRVVNGGSAPICYSHDANSIVFNNCDGQFAPSPNCSSILALGGMDWDPTQTKVMNGTTFVRAATGHISFNPYASCVFGDHCIVREIATHELGHALGLGHSQFADATMFGIAHFDGRCASIHQDDINAITFMYPATGGGPGPLTVLSTSPLGIATVGSAFSRQLLASGGATPYSWSLVSGSLPDGLNLISNGLISGTPLATGTSEFTVRVTDPQNVSAQKALSVMVIAPASGFDAQFVSQEVPAALNPSQAFFITIKWVNTGSKPWNGAAGFGVISQNPVNNATWGGNTVPWFGAPIGSGEQMDLLFQAFAPSRAGIYDFQWQLYQQGTGSFGQMSTNVRITVGDPGPPTDPPSIGGLSSLEAVKGTFFTYVLPATGGTPPYAWQVATGTLPGGLILNPNTGSLVGTPTAVGSSAVTVQLTDSKSQTAQKTLTVAVTTPPVPAVEITTSSISQATKGVALNQQFIATGGKPPYTWAVTGGGLPAGLSLAAATGMMSGTPAATGVFNFSVTATDAELRTAAKTLSITVVPPPLLLEPVPALDGLKGSSFNYQLIATGGTPAYTWSVTGGALPTGLNLNSATGAISGVPSVAGLFTVGVTVRDQASLSMAATIQIKLIDPETIPAVTRAKYKGGKKLVVTGERINTAAQLLLDGNQMPATVSDGAFILKPIKLAAGNHQLRIVNPGGVSSAPFMFSVE